MDRAPDDVPQAPRLPPADPEVPGALLLRVLDAVGIAPDSAESLASSLRVASLGGGGRESWLESLQRWLAPYPVRLRPCVLSLGEAAGAASPPTPLIGRTLGGAWLALLERRSDRSLWVDADGEERWASLDELAGQLGESRGEEVRPWVLLEAAQPCSDVISKSADDRLRPLPRLLRLLKPDRSDLWAIVLYAVFIGGLTLATPIAVQQLVNTVAFGALLQPVLVVALLLFGGLAFSGVLSVLQSFVAELIQRRVFVRVAMDLASRIPRVRPQAFDDKHGPELVNRLFDVFTVQKTGAALLLEGTSVVLQTVVGLIVLSLYHPWMLAFSILLVVCISLLVLVVGRRAVDTAIGESNAKYAVAGWMEELARHPATFRHPEALQYAIRRADSLVASYIGARRRHYRYVLRQITGAQALQVVAGTSLLALGGALVVYGQLTLGQLVASELIITAIVAAVAKLGKQLESFYDLLAATDKLGVLFDLPLETDRDVGERYDSPGSAAVELDRVSYRRGERELLEDFSLRVAPGARVLLSGPAGSGKSTLLDLLLGLRQPEEGFVAIDGHDLRDFRLADLRAQVVALGEAEIFPGTILENLRIARPGASTRQVRDLLDELGVLDAVRALPSGLGTSLSSTGSPLSDSEVAALMIARAVLAQPRLLLLDEAALRLEPAIRARTLDVLFDPKAPWTLIVVSQLDDVRARCDRVVTLGAAKSGPIEGEESAR